MESIKSTCDFTHVLMIIELITDDISIPLKKLLSVGVTLSKKVVEYSKL